MTSSLLSPESVTVVEPEESTDDDKLHNFCWKCQDWTLREATLAISYGINPKPGTWIVTVCGTMVDPSNFTGKEKRCPPCAEWKGLTVCPKGHDLTSGP